MRQKNINDIKTSRSGPTVTNVMYADDIILFSKATKKDARNISLILEKYTLWSGQLINKNKFGVLF